MHIRFGKVTEKDKWLKIQSFYGNETTTVDSFKLGAKKKIQLTGSYLDGPCFLRLFFSSKNYCDVIYSPEQNILIEWKDDDFNKDPLKITGSENSNYFRAKQLMRERNSKLNSLTDTQRNEPSHKELFLKYKKRIDSLLNTSQGTFFYLTAKPVFELSLIPYVWMDSVQLFHQHTHFFEHVDFSQSQLVHSTVLPFMYMKYFEKHVAYDEFGFIGAIDTIMKLASLNTQVREFSYTYLFNLFKKAGPEIIFEYLVERYSNPASCNQYSTQTADVARIMKLTPGHPSPDFKWLASGSDSVLFSSWCSKYDLTLLVFWQTGCSYCEAEWSNIDTLANHNKIGLVHV
ncbi:MAG: hypothetical protein ACHQF2_02795, partial [Flavobacteriales bacterium]